MRHQVLSDHLASFFSPIKIRSALMGWLTRTPVAL
jgi:hypothetical protein